MDLIDFQNYCQLLPGASAGFPFDERALVYKLHGKMFALTDFHDFSYISLKCEPDEAMMLRQAYPDITGGYHLNKRHWITLRLNQKTEQSPGLSTDQAPSQSPAREPGTRFADSSLTDIFIFRLVLNSYYLVLAGLPKRLQRHLPISPSPDTASTFAAEPPVVPEAKPPVIHSKHAGLQRPGRTELEAARKYIEAECDPLYLNRFDFHFGSSNSTRVTDSVKNALTAYQNPDGGFGHGLEPDFLLPNSSPMATTIAFQIIEELEGPVTAQTKGSEPPPTDNPLVAGAVRYLEQSYSEERDGWYAVVPTVNDHPHAPWWHWDVGEGMTVIDHHWGNPSAEIIAILLRYPRLLSRFTPAEIEAMSARAVSRLASQKEFPSPHEIYCYIRLYHRIAPEYTSEPAVSMQPQLTGAITKLMSTEPSEWTGYVPRPLDFTSLPASPLFKTVQPYAELHCQYLLQTLEQGVWQPHWSWGKAYPKAWQKSLRNWTADLTIKNYLVLERFGYLRR